MDLYYKRDLAEAKRDLAEAKRLMFKLLDKIKFQIVYF